MPKEIRETYEINATIEEVWQALTRLEDYPRWNPFVVRADCPVSGATVGAVMALTVEWRGGGGAQSREEVLEADAPRSGDGVTRALWVYSLRGWMSSIGMVRSVRTQRLSQSPGAAVLYESEISLSGWGVAGVPMKKIAGGMAAQAEALKSFVEGS